ncbi:transcription factor HES-7.1-A-like [Denticeps clupeoides]|uniref:transcription factor HES-7.1-A-like n=1 Tax=Denticeps clupeoides TaxID=299321 RepID=UPI0010A3E76E|nr:transcription factor HES-7.1-A-like [Denticeps clupeoides]
MKFDEVTDNMKSGRKLLKPQVERRRRERINHSLESLRTLLLQNTQHQSCAGRRVEKAEILEHTVLFLHTSNGEKRGGWREREQHHFMDGFSTCLEHATRFLRVERDVSGFGEAFTAALSRRLSSSSEPSSSLHVPARILPAAAPLSTAGSRVKLPLSHWQRVQCSKQQEQRSSSFISSLPQSTMGSRPHPNKAASTTSTISTTPPPLHTPSQAVWRPWP